MFNVSMQTVCVLYFVSDWVVEELSPAALLVSVPEGEAAVFLTTQALLYKVNRPAQVEVALPFFHLRQLDFAWLMNCDKTQLQGCLCCSLCVFFYISSPDTLVWETMSKRADVSQPWYQPARLN